MASFRLPVFALVDQQRYQKSGLPHALVTFTTELGRILPLFTTDESAVEFINTRGLRATGRIELKTEVAIRAILDDSKKEGISHVGLNLIGKSGEFHPIAGFIADLFGG